MLLTHRTWVRYFSTLLWCFIELNCVMKDWHTKWKCGYVKSYIWQVEKQLSDMKDTHMGYLQCGHEIRRAWGVQNTANCTSVRPDNLFYIANKENQSLEDLPVLKTILAFTSKQLLFILQRFEVKPNTKERRCFFYSFFHT